MSELTPKERIAAEALKYADIGKAQAYQENYRRSVLFKQPRGPVSLVVDPTWDERRKRIIAKYGVARPANNTEERLSR